MYYSPILSHKEPEPTIAPMLTTRMSSFALVLIVAAASTDTSTSQNRLREEALKQSIKTYLAAA